DKSVHGVLNPTYQAGLRRDAVQPDIEAERKKRDEIEAGKSYCSRRFGGATCDDKSAQIYAMYVDGHKAASDVRDEFVSVTEKLMDELAQCYNVLPQLDINNTIDHRPEGDEKWFLE